MTNAMQLAATMPYWHPAETRQHERNAQRVALVAEARAAGGPGSAMPEPPRRRSFIPRVAGALGLF